MVAIAYGPALVDPLWADQYVWLGRLHYVDFLAELPGIVLIALLAPRVAYRRRDALTLIFPPAGFRTAWVIGTRLAQLPDRNWPEWTPGNLVERPPNPLAAFAYRYRLWQERRTRKSLPAPEQ